MKLAQVAFTKTKVIYFLCFLIIVGGVISFFHLGQLEDPEFTVKTASITTQYPGASAKQVELEVTDLLETKLQEMTELKNVYSISRPGLSIIKVDIKNEYWADSLPQVWDVLRKKIKDVENKLPPGAKKPVIGDDFGYVFGFLLAVTSDGFSYSQLERYTKNIRKELSLIKGVARVDLWGVQNRQIYITVSRSQLAQLGITSKQVLDTLKQQNLVVDSGRIDYQDKRYRVVAGGEFESAEEIANLVIGGKTKSSIATDSIKKNVKDSHNLIRIKDIGKVEVGYKEPPNNYMYFDGKPAISMAIAPLAGVNAVAVGKRIDKKLHELTRFLPIGVGINKISWQSDIVAQSINDFMINLIEAIVIVLIVLAVTMGFKAGLLIGITGLLMPILATFIIMSMAGIDLQRVSLGAMIIAMGMMVDNAIVVADGYMVKVNQGMEKIKAAIEAASVPSLPLLGATIVACMAFYPIFASTYDTGEYARSLFQVVAISLLASWVLSVSITPLMCVKFLKIEKGEEGSTPYSGKFYQKFRNLLKILMNYRKLVILLTVVLLTVSSYAFKYVPQMFFPDSSRNQIMIDYWAPEGTRIQTTKKNVKKLQDELLNYTDVTGVATFIGQGPPRFYLPVNPEDPYSSYAQLIVNTKDLAAVTDVMGRVNKWVSLNENNALVRVRRYGVGAFDDWKIETRISGPADASLATLRKLSNKVLTIMRNNEMTLESRTNWRDRVFRLDMNYDQNRARWLGISRVDVANAVLRNTDGIMVGQYREQDDLIPIVLRSNKSDRKKAADNIDVVQIRTMTSRDSIPLSQVIKTINYRWEDPIIWRWDRRRAITIQASPKQGVTATQLRNSLLTEINKIKLPPGFELTWDGEYDSSKQSIEALTPGVLPAVTVILFIIIALFNAYRPPLIIILLIPFVMIGISFGLLITQVPFGFIALLGAMSLSGMMIKNAVVLLDQVMINLEDGMSQSQAIIESAISRLKPVMNATATTVLGMMPLLQDVFWISLAVTIIFGLAFGSLITMLLLPVLYALFYRLPKQ
jgi:multidrug efflux pump subunit AcrB